MTEPKKERTVKTYAVQFASGKDWAIMDPDSVVVDADAIAFHKAGREYLIRMAHVELYETWVRTIPVKDDGT